MFISWTFENKEVEVFEFEGKILFNPRHIGECLGIFQSTVSDHICSMNDKQVITLKNLDVDIIYFRKLANRCEI